MAKKVCMLVTNDFNNDTRVRKEARFLIEHGYQVSVACLKSPQRMESPEWIDGAKIIRSDGYLTMGLTAPPNTSFKGQLLLRLSWDGILPPFPIKQIHLLNPVVKQEATIVLNGSGISGEHRISGLDWGQVERAENGERYRRLNQPDREPSFILDGLTPPFTYIYFNILIDPEAYAKEPVHIELELQDIAAGILHLEMGFYENGLVFERVGSYSCLGDNSWKKAGFIISLNDLKFIGRSEETQSKLKVFDRAVNRAKNLLKRVVHKSIYTRLLAHYTMVYRIYRGIYKNALAEKADIYHAHDLDTLLMAYLASRKHKAKLVYDSHELFTEVFVTETDTRKDKIFKYIEAIDRFAWRRIERFLAPKTDVVFTVNRFIATELKKRYGLKEVDVLMNCSDYAPVGGSNKLREILDISEDKRILLFHGGLMPDRGLKELVESMQYIRDTAVLVFLGNGEIEGLLKGLSASLGLEDRVKFLDTVPLNVLFEYVSSADIGLIPYRSTCLNNYYCSPNKLFELMMCGVAVAGSDFPFLRDVISNHKLGGLFNADDPRDIANTVNTLIADVGALESMKANSRKAAEIFNWEAESKKLLEFYQRIEGIGVNNLCVDL